MRQVTCIQVNESDDKDELSFVQWDWRRLRGQDGTLRTPQYWEAVYVQERHTLRHLSTDEVTSKSEWEYVRRDTIVDRFYATGIVDAIDHAMEMHRKFSGRIEIIDGKPCMRLPRGVMPAY